MNVGWYRMSRARRKRFRGGGALIESMLVMPLIVMLGFGVVDYSYFFFLKNTYQGAAQAGARAAIPSAAVNSNVTSVVTSMMNAAGIASSSYAVALSPTNISGLASGTNVTVTVTSTWGVSGTHMLSGGFGGIGGSKQIVGVAVMQKEP